MIKVRTYLVNSSPTLFSFSIHAMYKNINRDQKQRLVMKSYIPGINSLIYPKIHYDYLFSDKNSH